MSELDDVAEAQNASTEAVTEDPSLGSEGTNFCNEPNAVAPTCQPASDGERPLTFGEKLVGLSFNPSGDEKVIEVKKLFAQVIDIMFLLPVSQGDQNKAKFADDAITQSILAQMMAVKALTWK